MRTSLLMLALVFAFGLKMCGRTQPNSLAISKLSPAISSSSSAAKKPDFATQIRPMLQSRCQPCHFQGGTMYQRLPFDRAETISALGTKLLTRIENEDQRRLIREFLAQP